MHKYYFSTYVAVLNSFISVILTDSNETKDDGVKDQPFIGGKERANGINDSRERYR